MELVYSIIGTFSGVCLLLLAAGLSMALRPWPDQPWVAAWVGSYWAEALTLLALSVPLLMPALALAPLRVRTFAVLNSGFFLVAGLQAYGWFRMRGSRGVILLTVAPMGVYLILFFLLGGELNARARVLIFSTLQALLQGLTALWAFQGLRRIGSKLGPAIPIVLGLHTLFYLVRGALVLLLPPGDDFALSVAIAMVEGLLFNFVLAYLQWMVITEGDLG